MEMGTTWLVNLDTQERNQEQEVVVSFLECP